MLLQLVPVSGAASLHLHEMSTRESPRFVSLETNLGERLELREK
jgi:hypothetical protein